MTESPEPYLSALKVLGKKRLIRTFLLDHPQPLNQPRHHLGVPIHFHATSVANKGRFCTGCCCPVNREQVDSFFWFFLFVFFVFCGCVVVFFVVVFFFFFLG